MKAVLKNGVIYPQEPLPKDWDDGTELRVEKYPAANEESPDDLDGWMARVQASADQMDPADEVILEESVRGIRGQARAELAVTKAPQSNLDDLDRWYQELEAACSQMDREDNRILKQAILEVRTQEKEIAKQVLKTRRTP